MALRIIPNKELISQNCNVEVLENTKNNQDLL